MFGFSLVGLEIEDSGVDQLKEPEGGPAVARSKCYGVLAGAFNAPDEEQGKRVLEGALAADFAEATSELPFELDTQLAEPPAGWTAEDLHSEYLRLFEVGMGGPPCPLYGGTWGGDRMRVMEEVVRFYNYFGLKSSEDRRIPPDHLSTELEFLHYLTFREAAAALPTLAPPYRRAQLDFIERQPGRWVPKLKAKLHDLDAAEFFTGLVDLTAELLERDHAHLADTAETPA